MVAGTIGPSGARHAFARRIDSNGATVWEQQYADGDDLDVVGVHEGPSGSTYVAGTIHDGTNEDGWILQVASTTGGVTQAWRIGGTESNGFTAMIPARRPPSLPTPWLDILVLVGWTADPGAPTLPTDAWMVTWDLASSSVLSQASYSTSNQDRAADVVEVPSVGPGLPRRLAMTGWTQLASGRRESWVTVVDVADLTIEPGLDVQYGTPLTLFAEAIVATGGRVTSSSDQLGLAIGGSHLDESWVALLDEALNVRWARELTFPGSGMKCRALNATDHGIVLGGGVTEGMTGPAAIVTLLGVDGAQQWSTFAEGTEVLDLMEAPDGAHVGVGWAADGVESDAATFRINVWGRSEGCVPNWTAPSSVTLGLVTSPHGSVFQATSAPTVASAIVATQPALTGSSCTDGLDVGPWRSTLSQVSVEVADMSQAADGRVVVLGTGPGRETVLVHVDADGSALGLWRMTGAIGRDIAPAADGGHVVCGTTTVAGATYGMVASISNSFNVNWAVQVGGPDSALAAISAVSDGGYVAVGSTQRQPWAVRLSVIGEPTDEATWSETGSFEAVTVTPDARVAAAGRIRVGGSDRPFMSVVDGLTLQEDFDVRFDQIAPQASVTAIERIGSSDWLLVGDYQSFAGVQGIWHARSRSEMSLIASGRLVHPSGAPLRARGVAPAVDGGAAVLVSGCPTISCFAPHVGLLKLSRDGAYEWLRYYSSGGVARRPDDLLPASDGGFMLATTFATLAGSEAQLIHADEEGHVAAACPDLNSSATVLPADIVLTMNVAPQVVTPSPSWFGLNLSTQPEAVAATRCP